MSRILYLLFSCQRFKPKAEKHEEVNQDNAYNKSTLKIT